MNGRKLLGLLAVLFALKLVCCAADAPAVPQTNTVLILGGSGRPQEFKLPAQVSQELKAQGIVTAWRNTLPGVTPEYLRQFNVVVLYYNDIAPQPNDEIKQVLSNLRAYSQEGGGLLIFKDLYMAQGMGYWQELLPPLGAQILNEEIIESAPSNVWRTRFSSPGSAGLFFGWTDVIEKHPATEGVEGLAYPLNRFEPGEPGVITFKTDANWKILVRTKPTAASFLPNPAETVRGKVTGPGSYPSSVPLLAVRDYGKGRIVLFPWLSCFTLMDGYSPMLDDGIVMRSEQKGRKSEGAKLVYNLLRWLAEPSRQLGGFGDYKPAPKKPISLENEIGFIPIDWNKPQEFGPAFKNCYMGLIGARTALSTGEGSPEEFISAAKAVGYQFIAFCEDINSMPQANWDKLVESCKKASDDTFLALPGMYYLDFTESAFVILGDIGYPPANWADPKNPAKKIKGNDTVRMGAKWLPPIIMLPFKENTRPARLYSSFYGYAGQVWEGDKLRVEDWDTYQQLQKEDLALFPTAVHIVRKPAEVADARRRGMQAFVRADSISKILESIDGFTSAHYRYFKPAFPSAGPEICVFYALNWGTSDLAVPGGDRFRIQMMARSEKGLAEVQMFDNGLLVRRFLLHGTKDFKKEIDEYHSGQHSYVLVVTDVDGGKAVSWNRATGVQEYWHGMCGDNMNDMGPGGKHTFDRGMMQLAGTEACLTPCGPAASGFTPLFINNGKETNGLPLKDLGGIAAMKESVLVSRFGGICEYSLDRRYEASGQPGIAYMVPIIENPYFRGKVRHHVCRRIPPGADLELIDYDFTIVQDVVLTGTPGLMLAGGGNWNLPEDSLNKLVYFTPQGECIVEAPTVRDGNTSRSIIVKPGEYVGLFPQATGIFPLDSELEAYIQHIPKAEGAGTVLLVGIGKNSETLKAGTRIKKTLAVVSLPLAAQGTYHWMPDYKAYNNSNLLMSDVRRKMGLAGPPAYQITPSVGAVENTRLVLRLKAEDYGFRGKISQCHLPLPLPVFIAPLNWRWSAGVWYKGKNKLLSVEWPPKDEYGLNANEDYVKDRERTDEIVRFGVFDPGTGYLQLDLEGGERDVFIGNLVTCNRPEFSLTLHRDLKSGKGSVEVHNPTDKAESIEVKPGKGFDLFGSFSKTVEVPAGASVMVEVN